MNMNNTRAAVRKNMEICSCHFTVWLHRSSFFSALPTVTN